MYELNGTIQGVSHDYMTGNTLLVLAVDNRQAAISCYDDLQPVGKLEITIDKYRERRSLNANNYAWALISKIGDVLRKSKEEVYFEMLKQYGQSEMISVLAHIPIGQYVKYCDEAGESTLNGKVFKHYRVYKGSSEFDTREMSIFIDGIVYEAKQLGIQTKTPDEIANLKSLWGE